MEFIYLEWFHNFPDEPIKIFSEIDKDRYETRKVEIFRDGTYGYAYLNIEFGKTGLGKIPFPENLDEINSDTQFKAIEITKHEFEEVWKKFVNK